MLQSPHALLHQAIIERLKSKAPVLRYIDADLGQIDNYDMKPPVSYPFCLIVIADEADYSDAGANTQVAEEIITLRVGMVKYTDSNNLVPANIRKNALQYYEVERAVAKALHNWQPQNFSKLSRIKGGKENREDDSLVRVLRFKYSYTDDLTLDAGTIVAKPQLKINITKP
jgi:hypothetical protein